MTTASSELPSPAERGHLGALLPHARWAAAVELALFVALFGIVNTFVPSTLALGYLPVPMRTLVYFAFAWLSLWLRGRGWQDVGLRRPERWRRALALGVGTAIALEIANTLVFGPLLAAVTHSSDNLSRFADLAGGNVAALVGWLVATWTAAAFGEEMIFRGYLLNRATDLLGTTRAGWAVSLLGSSVIFGLAHVYQGRWAPCWPGSAGWPRG